jgi:hypothetical protein
VRRPPSTPDGGTPPSSSTGDNAYQGSAVSVTYEWTATADDTGGGGPQPARRLDLTLTGRKRQRLLRQRGLVVLVRCSEACSIAASAKGENASKKVKLGAWKGQAEPGVRVKVKLRLSKKATKAARTALRRVRRLTMTVTVRATTGAGASSLRRRRISLR